jgi:hypothetical protein
MFIHNISNSEKIYIGQPVQADTFFFISETKRVAYSENETLLSDIMLGDAAISVDGENDLDEKSSMIRTLFGNQITTKTVMTEGGLRKSDRGLSFIATKNTTTTADYLITEDLQIKGGILSTDTNEILDQVGMEIVDTAYMYAGDWYPAEYAAGVPWSAALPTGVPLHAYIKDYPVSKDGITHINNEAITNTALNGLTIRISYKSTGTIDDVNCNVGILAYS